MTRTMIVLVWRAADGTGLALAHPIATLTSATWPALWHAVRAATAVSRAKLESVAILAGDGQFENATGSQAATMTKALTTSWMGGARDAVPLTIPEPIDEVTDGTERGVNLSASTVRDLLNGWQELQESEGDEGQRPGWTLATVERIPEQMVQRD